MTPQEKATSFDVAHTVFLFNAAGKERRGEGDYADDAMLESIKPRRWYNKKKN